MAAQTLSKHELFDRIESSIARMIDILKNRPRLPTLAPKPIPIATPPPPIYATKPLVSVITPPPSASTPPFIPSTMPRPTPSLGEVSPPFSRTNSKSFVYRNALTSFILKLTPCERCIWSSPVNQGVGVKDTNSEHSWKPPWCFVATSPYAAGKTEWRPP
ncbi:hypothetical protein Hanom_Chr09g00857281 [Helianthus anomalus]